MKNKTLYYTSIAIITALTICLFKIPMDSLRAPINKKKQEIITKQKVSPQLLYLIAWSCIKKDYYDPKLNNQDWGKWRNRYLPYIKTNDDVVVAINTMIQSLDDPYSRIMNIPQFAEQDGLLNSVIYGIGVHLNEKHNKIEIVKVIKDSPAEKFGLKEGDIILEIEHKKADSLPLQKVVLMTRGVKGSTLTLKIRRGDKILTKKVVRAKIKLQNVRTTILPNDIGLIQIASFMSKYVPKEFRQAIDETQNTKGIIIDLRGDAGGLLNNAIEIGNMMVNSGDLINILYRNKTNIKMPTTKSAIFKDKPIIILINSGTASASEILTGILRDNKHAILVGENTYGKNSIQTIVPLPNQMGMNLTTAKYLMPNNEDIHKIGIKPDYYIEISEEDFYNNKDTQLLKAIEVMNKITDGKSDRK